MTHAASREVKFDPRYVESLLLDESNIKFQEYAAGCTLSRQYSNIPENSIAAHVADIVFPLTCTTFTLKLSIPLIS